MTRLGATAYRLLHVGDDLGSAWVLGFNNHLPAVVKGDLVQVGAG